MAVNPNNPEGGLIHKLAYNQWQAGYNSRDEEVERLKSQVAGQTIEIEGLRVSLAEANRKLTELREKARALATAATAAQKELVFGGDWANVSRQLRLARDAVEQAVDLAEGDRVVYRSKPLVNRAWQEGHDSRNAEVAALQAQVKTLTSALETKTQEIETADARNAETEHQLAAARQALEELRETARNLRQAVANHYFTIASRAASLKLAGEVEAPQWGLIAQDLHSTMATVEKALGERQ